MPLQFELVTPERLVFRESVESVTLPTAEGEITVLPQHADLVAALVPGVAHFVKDGSEEDVAVSGGFIEITGGNRVRVLADTAERGFELDVTAIEAAKERAEKVMHEAVRSDDASYAAAAAALERELARYRVALRHRTARRVPTIESANLPSDENPS